MGRKLEQILVPAWALLGIVVILAAFQDWTGALFQREVAIAPSLIAAEKGAPSFVAEVPISLELFGRSRKLVKLFEDGKPFRDSMSSDLVVQTGEAGTWQMTGNRLRFNSLDGTSPLTNGRTYRMVTPDGASTKLQRLLQLVWVLLMAGVILHPPSKDLARSWATRLGQGIAGARWFQPVAALPRETIFRGLFILLSLLVAGDALSLYLSQPAIAVIRDDTEGSLGPALKAVDSGHLVLSWKRKFLYPMILVTVVQTAGAINGVAGLQMVLCFVVAPLIAWGVWLISRRTWVGAFGGLFFAHVFLQTPTAVYYSMSVLAEGISPFLMTTMVLGFAGFVQCRGRAWMWGSWLVMAVGAEMLYFLKPNWGLGVIFPFLAIPIRWVLHRDFRVPTALALVGSCALIFFSFNLVNKQFEQGGKEKVSFGVQTAFIAHLQLIRPLMERDLENGKAPHPEVARELLDCFDKVLEATKTVGHGGYKRIGYNPNLLMNGKLSINRLPLFSKLSVPEQNQLLKGYFLKMVIQRPFAYAGKVLGMFGYLFDEGRLFPNRCDVEFRDLLEKAHLAFASFNDLVEHPAVLRHKALIESYLQQDPRSRADLIVLHEHRVFRTLSRLFLIIWFAVPLTTLGIGILEWRRGTLRLQRPGMKRRIELALVANALLLLFFLVMGTNAAAYTLKVYRYTEFLLPITILALAAGLLFLAGEIREAIGQHGKNNLS